jgi:RNA 2',3'-cyclic 3'-phosphodiesterase
VTEARAVHATTRLFFALWPDASVREAIQRAAARWSWPDGARRVPAPKLHVTLHFLGSIARDRVDALTTASRVPVRPLELHLDVATLWPRGLAVLEASATPRPLDELHAALGERLRDFGVRTESRRWKPHVTLARLGHRARAPLRLEPIEWAVSGYALVESIRGANASYRVLERYGRASD